MGWGDGVGGGGLIGLGSNPAWVEFSGSVSSVSDHASSVTVCWPWDKMTEQTQLFSRKVCT